MRKAGEVLETLGAVIETSAEFYTCAYFLHFEIHHLGIEVVAACVTSRVDQRATRCLFAHRSHSTFSSRTHSMSRPLDMPSLPAELIAMILYDVHDFVFLYSVCRQLSRFCRDEIDRKILPSLLPKPPLYGLSVVNLIFRITASSMSAYSLVSRQTSSAHTFVLRLP